MGLSALTVWEVRTAGADVNGGGYRSDAGNTDYSIFDTPEVAVTDAVTNGTTTITSTNATFESAMIGNLLYITGGTGSITGAWYEVITRVSASIITVDRSTGLTTGTGATLNVGGALGSPGGLGFVMDAHGVAGMQAFIKSGTYTLLSATGNVSTGALALNTTMLNKAFRLKGYETTREDYGAKPEINAGAVSPTDVVRLGGGSSGVQHIIQIRVDGNSQAVNGITGGTSVYNRAYSCEVEDCDGSSGFGTITATFCRAISCVASGFLTCDALCCWADGCVIGVEGDTGSVSTIASNCTGDGFTGRTHRLKNCVSYNNGGSGFDVTTVGRGTVTINCISYGNTGYAWEDAGAMQVINCADGSNTSGRYNAGVTPVVDDGHITLTADPFTNAAGGVFSLNTTAGGGALLRAAGINPIGQTGFLDIGAVQHADPAGGASSILGGGQLTGGFS